MAAQLRQRARELARRLAYDGFDRFMGVKTAGVHEGGYDERDNWEYRPSPWLDFRRILPRSEVGPDDVFVDIGVGMGRMLLVAGRYPMKRVIGVEISEELAEIARANVQRARRRLKVRDVEVIAADALEWEIPDDLTIVYFFNPFEGETFACVFDRILASLDRAPRRMRVVYRKPTQHEYVMGTGRARVVREHTPSPGADGQVPSKTILYELS